MESGVPFRVQENPVMILHREWIELEGIFEKLGRDTIEGLITVH